MAQIKGAKEYKKFTKGGQLTRKESMLAKCYECNGYKESRVDCEIDTCPLYPFHHYCKNRA